MAGDAPYLWDGFPIRHHYTVKCVVSVPKLVLRDINDASRVPPGLCPITLPFTLLTTTVPFTTVTGNRSTTTGSDVSNDEHHLVTPATVLQLLEYGRWSLKIVVIIIIIIIVIQNLYRVIKSENTQALDGAGLGQVNADVTD